MVKDKNNGKSVRKMTQDGAGDIVLLNLAPRSNWSEMSESGHFVQFYETDTFLLDSLSGFIGAGLSAGEAAIVIATAAHRERLDERLRAYGLDVAAARASGQYVSSDAEETLSTFMVDGTPEPGLFAKSVVDMIARAAQEGRRRVRIFGEMVALLWAEGNCDGAIRLEELWNDLHRSQPFLLFCAYPMDGFSGEALAEGLSDVCMAHARVIPAESYTALADPDERLRAVVGLQQKARMFEAKIAEHERAEEISSHLAAIVESSDDAIISKTLEGIILSWNKGAERIFGYSAEEVIGKSIYILIPPERRDEEPKILEQLKRGERIDHYETVRVTKDGRALDISLTSSPIKNRSGKVIAVSKIARDITERKRAEIEREQLLARERMARAEAENANRMKDEFLATVSHELRTPLNAIIGWSHMLRDGRLNEATVERAVETIERNAKMQAQLIEDILDVSRMITGKLRLNVGSVDAAAVINAAIDSVQLAADSKGIHLEVTLDPSARHLSGDASRLQQVVWNLLSNAIKFTPTGGRVHVRLEHADSRVQIRVSDTGQGISPDFLPFVFDRFRQADGTSTRMHGGLGLGLAIVRHLVELHGGTVHADSLGEGCGATFTIRLPLAPSPERAKDRSRETGNLWPIEKTDAHLQTLPSLDGVQVLLVDDDRDTLNMLSVILTECQATVQTATSVAEALEALQWYEPDVMVSDLAMPGEDGYSLIAKVRALETENGKQIPAIALTAYVRVEDRARALSAGFNMFVPKPVEPNELITAIANLAEPGTIKLARV